MNAKPKMAGRSAGADGGSAVCSRPTTTAASATASARTDIHLQCRPIGGFHHADPDIRVAKQCQARIIPGGQALRVQLNRHDGLRRGWPLAKTVAGVIIIRGGQRMESQHAAFFGKRPLGIVGNMVPLPERIHLAAVKIVVVDKRRLRFLHVTGVGFEPGVGRLAQISRQSDERKIVVPRDRDERGHAAGAAVVRHEDAPPLA